MAGFDRKKVIEAAKAEVGYLEKSKAWWDKYGKEGLYEKTAGAGYDNYTKYGYEMHLLYPSVMDFPDSWCDTFVDDLFMHCYGTANAKKLLAGDFDDYTVNSANLYKKKNAWKPAGVIPEDGWQIFFKNSIRICHTGIVVDVVKNGNTCTVVTAEGNTSSAEGVVANGGCVKLKKYSYNYTGIAGYGVPPYDDEAIAKKIEFVPHWVQADGKWYYRVAAGQNAHGWKDINGHRYYFNKNGMMLTGFQKIDGDWFYFNDTKGAQFEGAMWHQVPNKEGAWEQWDLK